MVLDGLGVSILPDFMVRDDIRSGKLKCLLADERFVFHLKLLSRVCEKSSAQMKAFIEIFAPAIAAFLYCSSACTSKGEKQVQNAKKSDPESCSGRWPTTLYYHVGECTH